MSFTVLLLLTREVGSVVKVAAAARTGGGIKYSVCRRETRGERVKESDCLMDEASIKTDALTRAQLVRGIHIDEMCSGWLASAGLSAESIGQLTPLLCSVFTCGSPGCCGGPGMSVLFQCLMSHLEVQQQRQTVTTYTFCPCFTLIESLTLIVKHRKLKK